MFPLNWRGRACGMARSVDCLTADVRRSPLCDALMLLVGEREAMRCELRSRGVGEGPPAALEGRAAQEAEDVLVGIRCDGRASVAVAAAGGGGGA